MYIDKQIDNQINQSIDDNNYKPICNWCVQEDAIESGKIPAADEENGHVHSAVKSTVVEEVIPLKSAPKFGWIIGVFVSIAYLCNRLTMVDLLVHY